MPASTMSHVLSNFAVLLMVGRAERASVRPNAVHDVIAEAMEGEPPGSESWHLLRAALALVDQAGSMSARYTESSALR